MKNLLFLFLLLFNSSFAQEILFTENFDSPSGPDSVITYSSNPLSADAWNDTNFVSVSGSNSYHSKTTPFDSIFFETAPFSTLGNSFVALSFEHICKVFFLNNGTIEVSVDSGSTWMELDSTGYSGKSPNFKVLGYFYENSYPAPSQLPYWGGPTLNLPGAIPANSWWAKETFDISDKVGTIQANGDTGFADVRIRFALSYVSGQNISSGWYVDNLEVLGSTCELISPTIDWTTSQSQFPQEEVYFNSQKIKFRGSDNSGLDSAVIHFRKNGGPWQRSVMSYPGLLTCTGSWMFKDFEYTITGIALFDTIDYSVELIDCSCQNLSRSPALNNSYYTFYRDNLPPGKCGIAAPGTSPLIVDSLPWVEGFENLSYWSPGLGTGNSGNSHRGVFPQGNPPFGLNWIVTPDVNTSGFGWSIQDTWGTATNNTGPNGNHTLWGDNYVYAEASQGNTNALSQLITPCIDLSLYPCAYLEFYVHMYGADIGRLRVDVDTGFNVFEWQNAVWSKAGQIQGASRDDWQRVRVSLSEFAGKTIKIRFLAIRGNGVLGDMAIDDIRLFSASTPDAEVVQITSPVPNECGYGFEIVKARITHVGCNIQERIPVGCTLTNITSGTVTTVWDTLTNPGGSHLDTTFTFSSLANLTALADYQIEIFTNLAADANLANDTVASKVFSNMSPASLPYFCSFDAAPWQVGTFSNGVFDTSHFENSSANSPSAWSVGTEKSVARFTGPRMDRSGQGNYLIASNDSYTSRFDSYTSSCLDLSNTTFPKMSFWHHLYGSNILGIVIKVKESQVEGWKNVDPSPSNSWIYPGTQQNDLAPWEYSEFDLSAYAGKQLRIRIIAQRNVSFYNDSSDLAIDDLAIYDNPSLDVGVIEIVNPDYYIDLPSTSSLDLKIKNFGRSNISNIPVIVEYVTTCSGISTFQTATFSGNLTPGQEGAVSIPNPNYPNENFRLKVYTNYLNDGISFNDTTFKNVITRSVVDISANQYFQDFESCASVTTEGFVSEGGLHAFQIQDITNTSFGNPPSGVNAIYIEEIEGDDLGRETMLLPKFNGFDSIFNAELKFKHRFNFNFGIRGRVLYRHANSGGWIGLGVVGNSNCDSVYNYLYNNVTPFWQGGSLGNSFEQVCFKLDMLNGVSGDVEFKIVARNQVNSFIRWAIDDLEIVYPNRFDMEVDEIEILSLPITTIPSIQVLVKTENVGMADINTYNLEYSIDGIYIGNTAITPSQSILINNSHSTFVNVNTTLLAGSHTLCVWPSSPNGKVDENPNGDTSCIAFKVLGEKPLPYCSDFETGPELIADYEIFSVQDMTWEYGVVSKTQITSAYSGTKAWVTKLNGNYGSDVQSFLYSNPFAVKANQCTEFSFYHNYYTQSLQDGGNVEISYDGGFTWSILGNFGDPNWYNTAYVFGLGINNTGFSGDSQGWVKATKYFEPSVNGTAIARFKFGSNDLLAYDGWAIDDVCILEPRVGPCGDIGLSEHILNGISIYPSPAKNNLSVSRVFTDDDYKVTLTSLDGKIVLSGILEKGETKTVLDISNVADGMYLVHVSSVSASKTFKIVKGK